MSCSEGDKSNPNFVGVIERWNKREPLSVPYLGCSSNITLLILVIISPLIDGHANYSFQVVYSFHVKKRKAIVSCLFTCLNFQVENMGRVNYGSYIYDRKVI